MTVRFHQSDRVHVHLLENSRQSFSRPSKGLSERPVFPSNKSRGRKLTNNLDESSIRNERHYRQTVFQVPTEARKVLEEGGIQIGVDEAMTTASLGTTYIFRSLATPFLPPTTPVPPLSQLLLVLTVSASRRARA